MPDVTEFGLLDLTEAGLGDLIRRGGDAVPPDTTLDSVMKRLFDPRERDLVTVSAFGSSL